MFIYKLLLPTKLSKNIYRTENVKKIISPEQKNVSKKLFLLNRKMYQPYQPKVLIHHLLSEQKNVLTVSTDIDSSFISLNRKGIKGIAFS